MPASTRKQQNIPPLKKGGRGGFPMKKGGSGGISIVILVTPKSVIPNPPPRIACHPGKHQRARHSSNPPPPPAVFPTADSSPRFARFGMTRERNCHPEECQPSVSSRKASASKALLESAPGRYSEAIFGSYAGKDRMSASFRKQQNIPPFEKGGSGGISHECM
jgi:hypothetical protein